MKEASEEKGSEAASERVALFAKDVSASKASTRSEHDLQRSRVGFDAHQPPR